MQRSGPRGEVRGTSDTAVFVAVCIYAPPTRGAIVLFISSSRPVRSSLSSLQPLHAASNFCKMPREVHAMSNKAPANPFTALTWDDIEAWAGSRIVSRGKSYHRGNQVQK